MARPTRYTLDLANRLVDHVKPHEDAENKALHATTDQLIQGLSRSDLMPELSVLEMRAFIEEAERRIRDAEVARGGH